MSTAQLLENPEEIQLASPAPGAGPHPIEAVVLVGFSAPMLAFARRAASAGVRVHVVDLVTEPTEFLRMSSAVDPDGITMAWPRVGTCEGLEELSAFVRRVGAGAILTKDDYALTWLGQNRDRFEPECRVLAPNPAILERLLDKCYQCDRAVEAGFELLPSWLLTNEEAVFTIPGYSYPVVIRPSRPFSAHPEFKAAVIQTRQELLDLYNRTRWTWPPIVQPFCLGPNYVLHGMRSTTGEVTALRLFKAYRKYRGFATSIQEEPLPARLERAAMRFIEREDLVGPFHFDLLRAEADDCFYFLELNCRLGGTTVRVMALGYDEAGLLMDAFQLQTPRRLPALKARRQATSLSLNLQQVLDEVLNRRDPLAYPRLPRLKSLFAALGETLRVSDPLWSSHDALFSLRYPRWRTRA